MNIKEIIERLTKWKVMEVISLSNINVIQKIEETCLCEIRATTSICMTEEIYVLMAKRSSKKNTNSNKNLARGLDTRIFSWANQATNSDLLFINFVHHQYTEPTWWATSMTFSWEKKVREWWNNWAREPNAKNIHLKILN